MKENIENGVESEKQKRKGRPATGRTQKHVAFRCDFENIEYLESKANKGRWLNQLIRWAARHPDWEGDCGEMPAEPTDERA